MADYLDVVYSESSHPYTEYSAKLCYYLFESCGMKKNMIMLEPGCGRGEHLRHFRDLGLKVYGLDISKQAPKLAPDLEISVCDISSQKLPYPDNHFDIIYNKSFLEHLNEPIKFVEEAYRVLKPGGLFLSMVPDWETQYKIYFDDFTHKSPFSTVSLTNIYKVNNFHDVNVYKFRQLPVVWKYPILNYFCAVISPFIPIRAKNKFFRWSRELMLVATGRKATK
ncbi:class I SAM-dependent methyltransferase [Oceanospirillaceae bacterium]|nr:class I SAM-dependent methyltransferase [bacterium]MDB4214346.1 class I SAM-dependent methyltransferase [Oceanospirillaceae bacterium]